MRQADAGLYGLYGTSQKSTGSSKTGIIYMGGCQNYGPFLGPLNNRCRTIIGTQKRTIILTATHMSFTTNRPKGTTLRLPQALGHDDNKDLERTYRDREDLFERSEDGKLHCSDASSWDFSVSAPTFWGRLAVESESHI